MQSRHDETRSAVAHFGATARAVRVARGVPFAERREIGAAHPQRTSHENEDDCGERYRGAGDDCA